MSEEIFERKKRNHKGKRKNPVARELKENRHYRHRIQELKDQDFRLSRKIIAEHLATAYEEQLREADDEQGVREKGSS